MQSIISVKQSVIYLSIIMCLVLGTKELTIMWIIFLVVTGNVRRISRKKTYLYWIRMTGYFIVETIPLFLRTGLKNIFSLYDGGIIWVILAFSIGGMIWIHDYNINKIYYTKSSIATLSEKKRYEIFVFLYGIIGAIIFEEVFFRGYMCCMYENNIIGVVTSSLMFVMSHYCLPWSNTFRKKDFFRQFCIGVINGLLLIYSGSIIPCIIVHLSCNLNVIITELLRYVRYYISPEKYNEYILNDDISIDF